MSPSLLSRFVFLFACLPVFSAWAGGEEDRVRFTNQHADFRLAHQPAGTNLFALLVRDSDGGTNYPATNVVLVVRETAKLTVPDGFPELGAAGDDVWVLPQSQEPALLYLGISAEGLPPGLVTDRPEVRVTRLDAPGHFAVWQADAFAGLRFAVNSRDGLTEADRFTPLAGSHEHFNWGFSTNGHFTVWMQARATVGGTNAWSPETPFLFAVEPVPLVPAGPATLVATGLEPDGSLRLQLLGTPETRYLLERSADFKTWEVVEEVVANNNGVTLAMPPPGNATQWFFRAVTP